MERPTLSLIDAQEHRTQKWPFRKDTARLAFYVCKFLLILHNKYSIDINLLPVNTLRIFDAFHGGVITDPDIIFTNEGIMGFKGLTLNRDDGTIYHYTNAL